MIDAASKGLTWAKYLAYLTYGYALLLLLIIVVSSVMLLVKGPSEMWSERFGTQITGIGLFLRNGLFMISLSSATWLSFRMAKSMNVYTDACETLTAEPSKAIFLQGQQAFIAYTRDSIMLAVLSALLFGLLEF